MDVLIGYSGFQATGKTMKKAFKKHLLTLQANVAAMIKSHDRYPYFSPATFLLGGSLLYGGIMRIRRSLYKNGLFSMVQLPCPVVSVGNLTAGGTGKTPMTIHLAAQLQDMGYRVVVISRGYKGLSEKKGAIVSDGRSVLCNAQAAGDEPYLMATLLKGVPVVVGRNRIVAGQTALAHFNPDVILLDDAFQHQRLARDLNLLLVDARAPFGNGFLLPRGILREPVSSLERSDAIVVTRCQITPPSCYSHLIRLARPRPVFCTFHVPVVRCIVPAYQSPQASRLRHPPDRACRGLSGRRVFAFSGLADNSAFWKTIQGMGATQKGALGFDDHHTFQLIDIKRIIESAQQSGSDCLVTTEKDYVRIPQKVRFPMDLLVLGIDIDFKHDQGRWRRFIGRRLEPLMTP